MILDIIFNVIDSNEEIDYGFILCIFILMGGGSRDR